jgi:hypothetical protein
MKRLKLIQISMFFMLLSFGLFNTVFAQGFSCRIENDAFVTEKEYEFDVVLYANDETQNWEYALGVYYVNVDPGFINGGQIVAMIINNSSQLNAAQQVKAIRFKQPGNYLAIAAKTPPGHGNGTIIKKEGVRVCRVKLTNSVPYSSKIAPNLSFRLEAPNTSVIAYQVKSNKVLASNKVVEGQKYFYTPVYFSGKWNQQPQDNIDAVIYSGTLKAGITCRNYLLKKGAKHHFQGESINVSNLFNKQGELIGNGVLNIPKPKQ